jgi:hypothetical protein
MTLSGMAYARRDYIKHYIHVGLTPDVPPTTRRHAGPPSLREYLDDYIGRRFDPGSRASGVAQWWSSYRLIRLLVAVHPNPSPSHPCGCLEDYICRRFESGLRENGVAQLVEPCPSSTRTCRRLSIKFSGECRWNYILKNPRVRLPVILPGCGHGGAPVPSPLSPVPFQHLLSS